MNAEIVILILYLIYENENQYALISYYSWWNNNISMTKIESRSKWASATLVMKVKKVKKSPNKLVNILKMS